MSYQKRERRVTKEYTWLKRIIAWLFVFLYLLVLNAFYPIQMVPWLIVLFHSFTILIWYGSQVRIDSILIGFRYSLFFFLLSLSYQIRHENFHPIMIALSFSFVVLLMSTSLTLPKVKLGLDVIKPVGGLKVSIPIVLGLYNATIGLFVSHHWISNLISSFSICCGFILLYSIYSRKNILHLFFTTYAVGQLLFEYLFYGKISTVEYLIVFIVYFVFMVIQFNTKIKKKGD